MRASIQRFFSHDPAKMISKVGWRFSICRITKVDTSKSVEARSTAVDDISILAESAGRFLKSM